MADLTLNWSSTALGTDAYGDLVIGAGGGLSLNQGTESVRQAIELRLKAGIGDYFYGVDEGLPWNERFASLDFYNPAFDESLKNTVLATPGVQGILDWSVTVSRSKRLATITMQVQAQDGVIAFSLPLSA